MNSQQTIGRIEFEQGYSPSFSELMLESKVRVMENALNKQGETIKQLEWEVGTYRKFIGELLDSGKINDLDIIKKADKVMKCPLIKRQYKEYERG